jgi:hypothetical protein
MDCKNVYGMNNTQNTRIMLPKPQTLPHIQREPSSHTLGLKRSEREARPLFLPSAETTNSYSCTLTPPTCLQGTSKYSLLWLTLPKLCIYVRMNVYVIGMIYDIYANCNWVATRWQQHSTQLHTDSTQNGTVERNT